MPSLQRMFWACKRLVEMWPRSLYANGGLCPLVQAWGWCRENSYVFVSTQFVGTHRPTKQPHTTTSNNHQTVGACPARMTRSRIKAAKWQGVDLAQQVSRRPRGELRPQLPVTHFGGVAGDAVLEAIGPAVIVRGFGGVEIAVGELGMGRFLTPACDSGRRCGI
jgi:hypothetical protein